MKNKRRANKKDDFDFIVKSSLSAKKDEVYDVELKDQIKKEYLPIWEELTKRFYSADKRFAVLASIKSKLDPSNRASVLGLVRQMEDIFNILNIAEKIGGKSAESFYYSYGNSAMERYVKYFEYLSMSYYAKELAKAMGKDLREIYFNDSHKYTPEIRKLEANASALKREGTVEMLQQKAQARQPGE